MTAQPQHSRLTAALHEAQLGRCFHCGEPMHEWTREHVFPRCGNGRELANNIVLADPVCNQAKGKRQPTREEIIRAARLYRLLGAVAFAPATFDPPGLPDVHAAALAARSAGRHPIPVRNAENDMVSA